MKENHMKRTIMPVVMLAAMMQLNGAAGRAGAFWSAARSSGLLRQPGQVYSAGRATLPRGFVCPVGSRLISSGSPATAFRVSGRFGALARQTPAPQRSYWERFKRLFAPTGAALATGAAYMATQDGGEEEPAGAWLYRLPRQYAASEEETAVRAYYAGRKRGTELPAVEEERLKIQRLKEATEKAEKLYIELMKLRLAGAPKAEVDEAQTKWVDADSEQSAARRALMTKAEKMERTRTALEYTERTLPETLGELSAQEAALLAAGDEAEAVKVRQLRDATEKAETLSIELMKLRLAGAPKAEVDEAQTKWVDADIEQSAARRALMTKAEKMERIRTALEYTERTLPESLENLSAQEAQKASRVQMLEELE
jgi:hypothetical protein